MRISSSLLVAALAVTGCNKKATPPPAETAPAPATQQAAAMPAAGADVTEGEVLESIEVPGYTYMRVGEKGTEGSWAAVVSTPVKIGDRVKVRGELMTNFESTSLKRTFPTIRFGALDNGNQPNQPSSMPAGHPGGGAGGMGMPGMPPGHPPSGGAMPGQMPPGSDEMAAAHPPPTVAAGVEIAKVEKAGGPNGRRVNEVFAQRKDLSGKPVRVRGTVVKVSNGIMGTNFVHLRDGTGADGTKDNDLTATTTEILTPGQVVQLEGTLTADKDLGMGYRYDAILENAKPVN